jgi:hypothetical protein
MLTWFHRYLSVLGLLGDIDSAGFKDLNISTNNLIAPKKHVIPKSQPWMIRIWNVLGEEKGGITTSLCTSQAERHGRA